MDDVSRRAAILGGAAVMGSGGLDPSPLNAPPAPNRGIGVQAGAQTGIIIGHVVLVFGPAGSVTGVFVYATGTTPGLGNQPIVSLTNSTTDPFGNAVVPGVASYGAGSAAAAFAQLFGPQLKLVDSSGVNQFTIAAVVASGLSWLKFLGDAGEPGLYVSQLGRLVAEDPGSSGTPETWHDQTANLMAGWTGGLAPANPRVKLLGQQNFAFLEGTATHAATAGITDMLTLPAAYRPATQQIITAVDNNGAPLGCLVRTSGVVSVTANATTFTAISGMYSID